MNSRRTRPRARQPPAWCSTSSGAGGRPARPARPTVVDRREPGHPVLPRRLARDPLGPDPRTDPQRAEPHACGERDREADGERDAAGHTVEPCPGAQPTTPPSPNGGPVEAVRRQASGTPVSPAPMAPSSRRSSWSPGRKRRLWDREAGDPIERPLGRVGDLGGVSEDGHAEQRPSPLLELGRRGMAARWAAAGGGATATAASAAAIDNQGRAGPCTRVSHHGCRGMSTSGQRAPAFVAVAVAVAVTSTSRWVIRLGPGARGGRG